ncbi:CYTH domain-containing protein [uncultured Psychrobacter sp.]|uniref:CYTH and CHAD domain-containing protein n=1 Tax=uncultured Psychrobacter sp. TaxID=259303 RepID=UPI00345996A2
MQEIELKFLVPKARLKGLLRQAKVKSSEVTQMAAHYYDTSDQKLAQAGIGLRIRREGDTWVQTIKAGGDGIAARLEHNALLDNEQVQAMLKSQKLMPDLTIYKDTSIEPLLADFKLKKLTKKLSRLYVTDIERITRLVTEDDNGAKSSIEIAYDYGDIIHGEDDNQRQSIQEIEFELVSGDLDFLFTTAKTWCKRYKLYLSTVTKAERGGLLLHNQDYSPAIKANLKQLDVEADTSMPAFIRAVVHNCLLQILPNSSAIVAGSQDYEHVSQLHDGIQRLHTSLKTLQNFSDQLNPEWLPILEQTASLLDDYGKLSYLSDYVEYKLRQQGAPAVDWSTDIDDIKITPIDTVRANDFQLTLLEMIAFTMSDPSIEPQADKLAFDKVAKNLSKQYDKLLKALQSFVDSSENKADSTDKDKLAQLYYHLTSLRYLSEFAAPLYHKKESKKTLKRWLKRVKKAQKTLNCHLNKVYYQQHYKQKASTDANALYGAGWLAASQKQSGKRCQKRLDKVQDSDRFW